MADEFVMPKLGLTMEAGTIVGWLVDQGVEVVPGQPVLVIETDKVESEVEAIRAGLLHQVGEVGQEYPCGAAIGWLLAEGEVPPTVTTAPANAGTAADRGYAAGSSSALPSAASAVSAGAAPVTNSVAATGIGGRLLASPNAKRLAGARGIDLRTVVGTGPGGRITSEDVPAQRPAAATPAAAAVPEGIGISGGGRLATAAARNLADLLGIDIDQVTPTGVDPRATKEDVAAHVRTLLAAAAPPPSAQGRSLQGTELPAALQEPSSVIPMSGMRGTIARRMAGSLRSMAQLTLNMDVVMDGVLADRAERKSAAGDGESVPGFTAYVIAATAAALQEHPLANSQITDAGVALLPQIHIGLAVALDDGLIVPVIHDAPSLTLEQLGMETSRLAKAARSGSLTLPELEGGTFSVTALGMFAVDGFTPIINSPNTAILGVGRLRDDVAWSGKTPVKTKRLTLSLTWDHRAFDGAPAARFAESIKSNLEAFGNDD